MTRQELIDKLVAAEKKNLSYTTTQIITAIATATTAEKDSLASAIMAEDGNLVGAILLTLFAAKKTVDATNSVNAKIVADRIDIDDVAAVLNGY